jgi:uncharacterized protein YjiS (DUF1127 family)
MTELSLHGEYRPFSLDRRGDERREQARYPLAVRASAPRAFNPAAQHRPFLWASPDMPLTGRTPRRARTRHSAVLNPIRQAVAGIRLWCARARSRQELRELSDHMLKDIGLRREDVGYEFPKPFWHCN